MALKGQLLGLKGFIQYTHMVITLFNNAQVKDSLFWYFWWPWKGPVLPTLHWDQFYFLSPSVSPPALHFDALLQRRNPWSNWDDYCAVHIFIDLYELRCNQLISSTFLLVNWFILSKYTTSLIFLCTRVHNAWASIGFRKALAFLGLSVERLEPFVFLHTISKKSLSVEKNGFP